MEETLTIDSQWFYPLYKQLYIKSNQTIDTIIIVNSLPLLPKYKTLIENILLSIKIPLERTIIISLSQYKDKAFIAEPKQIISFSTNALFETNDISKYEEKDGIKFIQSVELEIIEIQKIAKMQLWQVLQKAFL